ncbi:MAG: DEAD/DEAH box helicase family protein [Sphingomonas sp.]|uniref:DEAD/DEAH box helicase family protein n=1 Tax=Sphingomonas sp. TaxID=28214 RepID=UPI003564985B
MTEAALDGASNYSGNLAALDLDTEYRSLKDDPVGNFYVRCLREASTYDRAVGYFRSTVFLVVGPAVIEFARRGGTIRMICSPDLDHEDVEQIAVGYAQRGESVAATLIAQFDALLADRRTAFAARTLATLISTGALEIKIAERRDRRGIYHEKIGIFSDGLGNEVSFKGSTNETWSGWHSKGNFESIEVFCGWRGGLEAKRVARHSRHFETLWSQKDPDIEVSAVPATVKEYMQRYAATKLDELITEPAQREPTRRSPLPHQVSAIDSWKKQGRRGVFEHATGSGKTFTAIIAIREHLAEGKPALVLVPSRLLLEQWAKELADEIPEAVMLLAGAGHGRWKGSSRLRGMTDSDASLGPRLIVAMMPTAAGDEFRKGISQGDHLLVVADEVHQIGSPQNSLFLQVEAGARLGLSATPQRYGDPDGTAKIFNYFGAVVPPPITLADAVATGRLVPYEYHPHPIHLTATEAEEWLKETKAIQLEIARSKTDEGGGKILSERARMMLIKRARIAKKASAKIKLAADVLESEFEAGQSWLIYCEDGGQLTDVLIALREKGMSPIEYHSNMSGDRDATMDWFKSYGGVLVSIRCLDEGVDIPAVSHALILASSQNPRQFIQRRGRVLRQAPGKALAVIHDAIVTPVDPEDEKDQLGLLRAELVRSVEFANHALNRMAGAELREIAINMGIDPDDFDVREGDEDDE